jgi:RNA polymerase sigma factor (sigma-70 family)
VHIPTYMVALINQWRHTQAELENKFGRTPEVRETADVLRLPLRKGKIIHQIVNILGSMKDTSGDDESNEEQTLEATLEDHDTSKPEDSMVADEEKEKVLKLLNEIDSREANVLRLHYGLDGRKPLTLKEIGEKLDLTRERIRQIQREALTKLYEYMNED